MRRLVIGPSRVGLLGIDFRGKTEELLGVGAVLAHSTGLNRQPHMIGPPGGTASPSGPGVPPGYTGELERRMNEDDLALRNLTYTRLVEIGRAPTAAEIAVVGGLGPAEVMAGWERLHAEHALVLDPATGEIRMAHPFSGVPTAYRVQTAGRWWYGNCAWDAFGICAALHEDGEIETSCPDCGESLRIAVRDQRPDDESLLFHCLVAAAHWWDDIVFA